MSAVLFLLLLLFEHSSARICQSINVRNNVANLGKLSNCTVVEGYVQIVLMEKATEQDFELWSFPELREITQYLLFYRVKGLRNLGKLFPNLVRIGGSSLFIDYGLVIHEMFSLQEVGLASLREISRGSVIVTKNPTLCYVNTVSWETIARWDPVKNYVAKNKNSADCPGCQADCPQGLCWSRTECQVQPESSHCHPLCVGGCSGPGPRNCHSCGRVLTSDGECVQNCPLGTYQYLNRRCIRREECTAIDLPKGSSSEALRSFSTQVSKYIVFNGTCTDNCPPGYEFDAAGTTCVPCKGGKCHKWCHGQSIENIGDAEMLRGCTHIQGSLEISIRTGKPKIVFKELEDNLGSIEEIENYLKIVRSFPIVNLKFLKNLTVIHGKSSDAGFGDNYSLLVLENPNLQELWDWDSKRGFKIMNGKVFFHYNPKLCLQHIHRLLTVIHHDTNVSNLEVGKDSNGDKFPCNATEIDLSVTFKSSCLIQINVPYLKLNYGMTILRYVVYFTKASHQNITMFDDLDQCSDYGWRTKDVAIDPSDRYDEKGFHVNLTDLEPFTQYAFYVTTYTIDRYGAKSSMYYEKTLPAKPSEMKSFVVSSNKSSEITLKWEPPKHINGKLEKFVITWMRLHYDESQIKLRNYCENPLDYTSEIETHNQAVTDVNNKEDSCCPASQNKQLLLPKDGFEKLCSNFDHCPLEKDFSIHSCESCFYSLVYKDPLLHTAKKNLTATIKTVQKLKKTNSYNIDFKKTKIFTASVLGNKTTFMIDGVLHFQDYLITIKACREIDPNEPDKSEDNSCSNTDIATVRTRQDDLADRIDSSISYQESNSSVILYWTEPSSPNGLVVAYEIEHINLGSDNTNPIVTCITTTEFEYSHRKFSILGLAEGAYKVRVRAVSLAGKGQFSDYIYFKISNTPISVFYALFGAIITSSFLFFIGLIFMILIKKKRPVLIASVNPDYHYIPDEWEISRESVELVSELGIGAFGKVYQGILRPKNLPCAVKTVNDNASPYDTFVFLTEASVMKNVSKAYHIVHLLGVVSEGHPPLVIMELMELGDLKTYLRSTRDSNPPTYASMINMALQIADGMTFMEAKKYVHRDLAARNCMVNKDCVVKVGDFGMTRDVYETDYYRKNSTGLLPIRWMAPESLKDGVFTSQSDVWSFGVVLWEITTLAEQPYQGSSNDQVLQEVIAGRKLDTPNKCPETLRNIMVSCWKAKPSQRMKFMQIVTLLEYFHDEEFKKVSYYYSQEAKDLRKSSADYVEMRSIEDPLLGSSQNQRPEEQNRPGNVSVLLSKVKLLGRGDRLSRIEEGSSSEYQI
ncbi:insulin receptor-like [Macrosteles quadrilineatus]|uniref:insulin receptor-like n=1 Tax=Macrosteles quadrilineatus TaxID=74068 RepID=UPI0023E3248C|nr:insulin receptor-like [Macrosteles quadrilineatus]XP_054262551.1 insulin receptor-like [Macrosteles quadrilineatus]XP_054262552.1 insulin receptor-like [Macrosteles quadrilineatus]XP_054262553.1 insulin receptor-like [Macrosteles quadrilineatus]